MILNVAASVTPPVTAAPVNTLVVTAMDYRGRADEPVAVLNAAIQELVHGQQIKAAAPTPKEPEVPLFIPAASFQGIKKGYYFGTGEEGTG